MSSDGAGNWVALWYSVAGFGSLPGSDANILVARSTDNGASWSPPATLYAHTRVAQGRPYHPQLTNDGAGNWIAVFESEDDLGGTIGLDPDILLSRSTDNGASWSAPSIVNTNAATDAGFDVNPQMRTDGAGNWIAVWEFSETQFGHKDILSSQSVDGGATWSHPTALNSDPGEISSHNALPQVGTDSAGNWIAVWGSAIVSKIPSARTGIC